MLVVLFSCFAGCLCLFMCCLLLCVGWFIGLVVVGVLPDVACLVDFGEFALFVNLVIGCVYCCVCQRYLVLGVLLEFVF